MQLKYIQFKVLFLFLSVYFFGSSQANAQKQYIKLSELISCYQDANYPTCLFDKLDQKGYVRIDKQYTEYCERVIYYWGTPKPSFFVNPSHCSRPVRSSWYPVKGKDEIELQFQKSGRAYFETLSAQIRKSCKALPAENGTNTAEKGKAKIKAYRHEASGTTILIRSASPVAYIYLVK
jgi:hypothetical protein